MRGIAIAPLLVACRFASGVGPTDGVDDARTDATTDAGATDGSAITPDAPKFALRYNLGGSAHTGIDYPGAWDADPGTCTNELFWYESAALPNSNDDPLFQRYMYGDADCTFGTNLPPAMYRVTMLFAEVYVGSGCPASGSRNFDVSLEGTLVITNLDVYAVGGGCAHTSGHPFTKAFTVMIADGKLDLALRAHTGYAMLSAIEIVTPP